MGARSAAGGHSPVVPTQRERALWGGRRAALEVVDASFVDDDKAQGPCGRQASAGGEPQGPLSQHHSGHSPRGPGQLNPTERKGRELGWHADPSPGVHCRVTCGQIHGHAGQPQSRGRFGELCGAITGPQGQDCEEGQSQGQNPREATAALLEVVELPGDSRHHRLAQRGGEGQRSSDSL